jgi:hypothetical protein
MWLADAEAALPRRPLLTVVDDGDICSLAGLATITTNSQCMLAIIFLDKAPACHRELESLFLSSSYLHCLPAEIVYLFSQNLERGSYFSLSGTNIDMTECISSQQNNGTPYK